MRLTLSIESSFHPSNIYGDSPRCLSILTHWLIFTQRSLSPQHAATSQVLSRHDVPHKSGFTLPGALAPNLGQASPPNILVTTANMAYAVLKSLFVQQWWNQTNSQYPISNNEITETNRNKNCYSSQLWSIDWMQYLRLLHITWI